MLFFIVEDMWIYLLRGTDGRSNSPALLAALAAFRPGSFVNAASSANLFGSKRIASIKFLRWPLLHVPRCHRLYNAQYVLLVALSAALRLRGGRREVLLGRMLVPCADLEVGFDRGKDHLPFYVHISVRMCILVAPSAALRLRVRRREVLLG